MAYTKYSLTPANNTATPPDGAPEGMLPSAVNDTMRDMMAQIRDCGDGIRDGTYTMTAPKITGGTITGSTINNSAIGGTTANSGAFTTLSATGNTSLDGGSFVFNESGADKDFRIEGDTDVNLFFSDASTDRIGIGTSSPGSKLHVEGANVVSTVKASSGFAAQILNAATSNVSLIGFQANAVDQARIIGDTSTLQFCTGSSNTERMRIDSSGNVGIGTSSPTTVANRNLQVYAGSGQSAVVRVTGNAGTGFDFLQGGDGVAYLWNRDNAATLFGTNNTESMRITSGGVLCVNGTAQLGSGIASFTGSASVGVIDLRNSSATSGRYWRVGPDTGNSFLVYNEANTGVYLLYGGTSWTSSSDERLKDIIEPISNAAAKVSSLRAVIGKFKTDEQDTRRAFLIAQDVEKVLPEAVNTDAKGNLGLQYTDTIPLLVAAIKEQQVMIEELKQEVAALKAK